MFYGVQNVAKFDARGLQSNSDVSDLTIHYALRNDLLLQLDPQKIAHPLLLRECYVVDPLVGDRDHRRGDDVLRLKCVGLVV